MTDIRPPHEPLAERVSGLEASVSSLRIEIEKIDTAVAAGFQEVRTTLNSTQRTNWTVILSGMLVVGALWASAIKPIQDEVMRQELERKTLATAVLEQNKQVNDGRVKAAIMEGALASLRVELDRLTAQGSPITDKRVTLMEQKLMEFERERERELGAGKRTR